MGWWCKCVLSVELRYIYQVNFGLKKDYFRVLRQVSFGTDLMRHFGVWVLFIMVVGTGLVFLVSTRNSSSLSDTAFQKSSIGEIVRNRKLKENYSPGVKHRRSGDTMVLEDYHLIDPVPSSKATIRHKPIQHGTPLMPFIPRAPPPTPPFRVVRPGGRY